MFNQFAPDAKLNPGADLIPLGTLAFCVVTVKSIGTGRDSGGRNAQLELTIAYGPQQRRKLWHYLGDPSDKLNSEKYQQMSMAALQAMLEACGIFQPANPATYQRFANADFLQIVQELDGKTVAVKTKIDKGKDGFEDKSVVADWLTPNPASRNVAKWNELVADHQAGYPAKAPSGAPVQAGFALGGVHAPVAAPAAAAAPVAVAEPVAVAAAPVAAAAPQMAPQAAPGQAAAAAASDTPSWLNNAQR